MNADYERRALAQEEEYAQLIRDTEHELRTNPEYQPYFAGYTPTSVELFIKCYAQSKVNYLRNGPNHVRWRLHQVIEYQEDAYERMFDIQQKKLFDLQVRWRAGELTLPNVFVGQQFDGWADHIHRCPFLPPVTPDEYALYRAYLASEACQDVGHHPDHHRIGHGEWQQYDGMRRAWRATQPDATDDEKEAYAQYDYPAWYAYYDAHHGRPPGYPFATHPDLRGDKERFYLDLACKEYRQQRAHEPVPVYDQRRSWLRAIGEDGHDYDRFEDEPTLFLADDYDYFLEFTRRFDPDATRTLEYVRATRQAQSTSHNRILELTEQNLQLLQDAPGGRWPIEAHADWRQGVLRAAQQLHRELLLAAMTAAYEDYCFRIEAGLLPAPPDKYRAYHDEKNPTHREKEFDGNVKVMPYLEKDILRGRELNGEPRDFDY